MYAHSAGWNINRSRFKKWQQNLIPHTQSKVIIDNTKMFVRLLLYWYSHLLYLEHLQNPRPWFIPVGQCQDLPSRKTLCLLELCTSVPYSTVFWSYLACCLIPQGQRTFVIFFHFSNFFIDAKHMKEKEIEDEMVEIQREHERKSILFLNKFTLGMVGMRLWERVQIHGLLPFFFFFIS